MDQNGNDQQFTVHNVKEIGHEFSERITTDAAIRVAMEEEQRVKKVFRMAKVVAKHAGRKTIKEEDVQIVYQMEEEL